MSKKKNSISKEEMLTASGYDVASMTSKQQDIVYTYLRNSNSSKYSILIIAAMVIVLAATTFIGFFRLKSSTNFLNSREVVFYAVVTESDDRIFEPGQVKQIADDVVEKATINGVRLATTGFLFAVVLTALFQDRDRRRVLAAFLPEIDKIKTDGEINNK